MTCFHFLTRTAQALPVFSVAFGVVAGAATTSQAGTVTFGTGGNQFQMEFVTIGNPGNTADTTGIPNPVGRVEYVYSIGKFEVSENMIDKYNLEFGNANSLTITKDSRGPNKPATSVSWNEAARFINWLNTSTGNQVAYKFTTTGVNDNIAMWNSGETGYDASNPWRNSFARYFLPSADEWYKAAYFDPNNKYYYDYTTGSDTAPTAVDSGRTAGTAVYYKQVGPADVDQAGGLSPFGVMGLGGNVYEWDESLAQSIFHRGVRGGYWAVESEAYLSSSVRLGNNEPGVEQGVLGFRVASLSSSTPPAVPESSMMVIGTLFGLGGLVAKRRMNLCVEPTLVLKRIELA